MPSGLDFLETFKEFNRHFGLAVLAYKLKSTCVVFSESSSEVKVVHFVRDGQWRSPYDRFQYRRCHIANYLTLKTEARRSSRNGFTGLLSCT